MQTLHIHTSTIRMIEHIVAGKYKIGAVILMQIGMLSLDVPGYVF